MFTSALLLAGVATVSAGRGQCYLGGDPHVRGFDKKRGWTFHPVYAPGAWWLVNTESGDFQAQAMYSQCGRRTGGGWQGWKKNVNDSAHCLESVAMSMNTLDHKSLVIQPPCTWNWGNMTCNDCTADRLPRVMFDGKKIQCTNGKWMELAEGLKLYCRANRAQIKYGAGDKVAMVLSFWGGRGYEPRSAKVKTCTAGTHASMHLWMNSGDFGPQCGHCGNFDGNDRNDNVYDKRGAMTKGKLALCDADVKDCQSLFPSAATPTRYNSNGYIVPEDESLCGCAPENACKAEGETRKDVKAACAASYKQVCKEDADPLSALHEAFFDECIEDVCNGGLAFTEVDVGDESEMACSENQALNDDAVCNHCVSSAAA